MESCTERKEELIISHDRQKSWNILDSYKQTLAHLTIYDQTETKMEYICISSTLCFEIRCNEIILHFYMCQHQQTNIHWHHSNVFFKCLFKTHTVYDKGETATMCHLIVKHAQYILEH